jgi:hypothetical protein
LQPGIVALRRSITAAWQNDLRAVRQDSYDVERGREAWAFIQRFNTLVSDLRVPIQRAWGAGGLVHVADSPDIAGPGPRVSMTRVKLRNHGNLVAIEASTHSEGEARPNPELGLDREIEVVGVAPLVFVQELYGTLTAFLQSALSVDLELGGSRWLFEQVAAEQFVASTR